MVRGFVKRHFFGQAGKGVSFGDKDISTGLSNFDWHRSLESSKNEMNSFLIEQI
jgi:hypothetical protein